MTYKRKNPSLSGPIELTEADLDRVQGGTGDTKTGKIATVQGLAQYGSGDGPSPDPAAHEATHLVQQRRE